MRMKKPADWRGFVFFG
ncbi:hypothetical protein YPPY65_4848, partial [Yersinia pestis PY-65]